MKIIEPSFEIVNPKSQDEGIQMLRAIERYARISHRSEDAQTDNSWERFIKAVVLDKGDWSVVEHCSATVIFRVDRGVTHEIVRHRLFSYTQESTRFCNYGRREIEFIEPAWSGNEIGAKDCSDGRPWRWKNAMDEAERAYLVILGDGASPQIARSVLPNAMASTIAMTGNLRSWRQFLSMRSTKETHPDLKRVVVPLLAEMQYRIPILYSDIEPNRKQSIAMAVNR